jgi:hypothetical protein
VKKLFKIVLFLLAAGTVYAAEFYTVNLTRVEQDLYRDTITRGYIQTEYCYVHVYNDEAVLKYDRYSYDNFVIFSDGDKCKVKAVFK